MIQGQTGWVTTHKINVNTKFEAIIEEKVLLYSCMMAQLQAAWNKIMKVINVYYENRGVSSAEELDVIYYTIVLFSA